MMAPDTMRARLVTLRLAAVLGLVLSLNGLLSFLAPAAWRETTLDHTRIVFTGGSSDDSWGVMSTALEHVREHPEAPLYRTLFFEQAYRFQYPPSSLFALMALEALETLAPERLRTTEDYSGPLPTINDVIGWVALLATVLAAYGLLELGLRPTLSDDGVLWRLSRLALVGALALTFYPLVKAFSLGQIQTWLNAIMALALLAWASGRRGISGALVGLLLLVKPHYGLILLWGAADRAWRFVVAGAVVAGTGVAAAVLVFGFATHLDYLSVLSFLSRHGETFYPNQSVNGLLNRLAGIDDATRYTNLTFPAGVFPPYNVWIHGATVATSLALVAVGLLGRSGSDPRSSTAFATMVLCVTMASPIAWEHHYGAVFPLFAILFAASACGTAPLRLLLPAYVLVSTPVMMANALANTTANVLQSTLLFGATVLLVISVRAVQAERSSRVSSIARSRPADVAGAATPTSCSR